jgi:hypothetical protein
MLEIRPLFFGTSATGGGSLPSRIASKISSTSSSTGKRPALAFEKMTRPSRMTSNWPDLPGFISAFSSKRDLSDAARLAARGLYPQAEQ